jgi:putative oxidoreductase
MRDSTSKHIDIGLLIMRIGLGLMFIFFHGWAKITGGPERWEKVGAAIGNFGIDLAPQFWGFMAAVSEFGGGLCLILGLLFRPATALMLITMIVAASSHIAKGQGIQGASHAIEVGFAILGLLVIGPGKFSLDWWIRNRGLTFPGKKLS